MSCSGLVPVMRFGDILNNNQGRIIGQILLLNQLSDAWQPEWIFRAVFVEICVVDAHASLVRILFFCTRTRFASQSG